MRNNAGTAGYMAPEVVQAKAEDAHATKVDVYSYGILLYVLYSNDPNWLLKDPQYCKVKNSWMGQLHASQSGSRPVIREGLPADIAALMPRCWAEDPVARPSFCEICAALQPTRMRLAVQYKPGVHRKERVTVTVQLYADDARAEPPSDAEEADADGLLHLNYIVPARPGDTCMLRLAPVASADDWLGGAECVLGDALRELTPQAAPLRTATLHVTPEWARCPESGHRTALKMTWKRCGAAPPAGAAVPSPTPAAAPGAPQQSFSSSLGALSLRLAPTPSARWKALIPVTLVRQGSLSKPQPHADIMISYRDTGACTRRVRARALCLARPGGWSADCNRLIAHTETGRMSANQFSLAVLVPWLEAAGYTCFCYALRLRAKDAWVSVLTDGIQACKAFIPVCSPTYADLSQSPWTSNELFHAARTARQRAAAAAAAAAGGDAPPAPCWPHIIPLWHSGAFPPPDTRELLLPLAGRRVPAAECAEELIRRDQALEVMRQLVARLTEAGVHPSRPPAAAPAPAAPEEAAGPTSAP